MKNGRLILKGKIELLSPALIGSGNNDYSDCDIILDEGKPFIPSTSFIGALKHYIKINGHDNELKFFWGFTEGTSGRQSNIICSDLRSENAPEVLIRDGIKIEGATGIIADGKKYDYQVVEKGAEFNLYLEAGFNDERDVFPRRMIATIRDVLKNKKLSIGAKTNSGLGKIMLKDDQIHELHFSNKKDVFKWLKNDFNAHDKEFHEKPFEITGRHFSINAGLILKNSFIIRSYSETPGDPDSVSIKSGDDFVITGTSLKGAIRNRAERIVKTLGKSTAIVTRLFGNVEDEKRSKNAVKGRIQIEEVILPKISAELQTRIKIDRFTGGTIESALFDSMPLFSNDEKIDNIKMTISKYEDHEAGLMLLVLKDIWTGDLAVGGEKNVGRGVFKGFQADIKWDNGRVTLKNGLSGLSIDDTDKGKLEVFVEALIDFQEVNSDGK